MKKLLRFLILVLFVSNVNPASLFAQISHGDSVFLNNICKESMYISYWNNPGQWFHKNEIASVQDFYDQVDSSYIFTNDEFADCYRKIVTSSFLEMDTVVNQTIDNYEIAHNNIPLFGNKNPFVKLKFTLNNKSAYSYALLDSSSKPVYNNDYAFVLISGTGTNQIKTILDGNGYHDLNCYVRNLLKPKGDVFIMSMPNEDHRAIYFNRKKATSLPTLQPPYLISYLNAANKSIGLNRLIETVAFIKHLKSKYKKVFVFGLSTGGKVALWASLLSEPDASLVASGYSILVDNDYNSQLINSMSYGNYLLVYDKDSTRSRLGQLHTQFLFTQAQNDGQITQYDIDSSITKNFFSPLNNVSFFSNFIHHSFPPCPVIDSFLQRCFSKAKVFISTDQAACNKDSIVMDLHFFGKPPFSFQLYRDSTLVSTQSSADTSFSITLFDEGNYLIRNIMDSASVAGYTSDTFTYKKQLQPVVSISRREFVCDSNKTKILFDLVGASPFLIHFMKDNVADSIQLSYGADSLLLPGGHYNFANVVDGNHCAALVQDSLNLYTNNLDLIVDNIQYNCISNSNEVALISSGVLPINLTFFDSTINSVRNVTLSSYAQMLMLDSGAYKFLSISDSNNCVVGIDTTIAIISEPLSFSADSLQYTCHDNFSVLPIQLKGKANWQIQMQHDGNIMNLIKYSKSDTIHLEPGITTIVKVRDANNCEIKVKDSVIINTYKKISSNVFTSQFDCEKKETAVQLHSIANFPLRIIGQQNGVPYEELIYSSPSTFMVTGSTFSIDTIVDFTQCRLDHIFQADFANDTLLNDVIYLEQLTLKSRDTSYAKYLWFLNDELLKETSGPALPVEKNGVYQLGVYNNNNCLLKTRKLLVDMGKMLIYPNPFDERINIIVHMDPQEEIKFKVTDLLGKLLYQGVLSDGLNKIDMPGLLRGIYLMNFESNKINISYPSQKIFRN